MFNTRIYTYKYCALHKYDIIEMTSKLSQVRPTLTYFPLHLSILHILILNFANHYLSVPHEYLLFISLQKRREKFQYRISTAEKTFCLLENFASMHPIIRI